MGVSRKFTWFMICMSVLLAIVFLVTSSLNRGLEQEEASLQSEIDSVRAHMSLVEDTVARESTENVASAYGVDLTRITHDEVAFEEFAKRAFTWENYAEYMEARKACLSDYGIGEDTWFMREYMPEISEYDNGYGTMVNVVDNHGYNLGIGDVDVRLMSIDGSTYQYFAEVQTVSTYKDQTGDSYVVLLFETDKDGKIGKIDALPVSEQ